MTRLKVVGKVTEEEKGEIQQLFERRNGLNELAKILTADNKELYEKIIVFSKDELNLIKTKVSRYACENHRDFIAEYDAAVIDGKVFDQDVVDLYNKIKGL